VNESLMKEIRVDRRYSHPVAKFCNPMAWLFADEVETNEKFILSESSIDGFIAQLGISCTPDNVQSLRTQ
jgi:hypothetical protein